MENNQLKVLHKKSNTFKSDHATGAYIIGPTNDGLFFLTFYTDCVTLNSETGILQTQAQEGVNPEYTLTVQQDDMENYREDKVSITLSHNTILTLRDLLNKQFPV